jgi:4a-hydroxytetrahydrobiopterin dehydratase
MEIAAQMAGFMLRAHNREATAAFYRKLGLSADEHAHGGPIHFEIGPTSPNCVAEIYKRTEKFPRDAIMVKVESLDLTLFNLGYSPDIRREVGDMRLAYVTDPDGRAVMVYEEVVLVRETVTGLAAQACLPCGGGIPTLTENEVFEHLVELDGWLLEGGCLEKTFTRKDFPDAMLFAAAIVPIAETEQHHPDVAIYDYKYVKISLITKTIKGLSINDFIVAAKIDALVK